MTRVQIPFPPRRGADGQSANAEVSQVQTRWAGTSAPPEMQVPAQGSAVIGEDAE